METHENLFHKRDEGTHHQLSPHELTVEIDHDLQIDFALIPEGRYTMGSSQSEAGRYDDEIQHEVVLTKAYYMAIYPTTRAQFASFLTQTDHKPILGSDDALFDVVYAWVGNGIENVIGASWQRPGFPQEYNHPVVCVSFFDAKAFCKWLGDKVGMVGRLPTEAEWEYACRAGTTTAYQWGNDPDQGLGWCNAADLTYKQQFSRGGGEFFNWSDGFSFTSPVGKFHPNDWGLYDMHGNVQEWCGDVYAPYPTVSATDPNPMEHKGKGLAQAVTRGGCWDYPPRACRSASRDRFVPENASCKIGFRVVVECQRP